MLLWFYGFEIELAEVTDVKLTQRMKGVENGGVSEGAFEGDYPAKMAAR